MTSSGTGSSRSPIPPAEMPRHVLSGYPDRTVTGVSSRHHHTCQPRCDRGRPPARHAAPRVREPARLRGERYNSPHMVPAEYFLLADAELQAAQPHIMSGSDAPGHLAVSSNAEHCVEEIPRRLCDLGAYRHPGDDHADHDELCVCPQARVRRTGTRRPPGRAHRQRPRAGSQRIGR